MTPQSFVNKYFPLAVQATKGTTINPLTALTQAALETGWNTSELAQKANNFFGIKHFDTYPNKYGVYRKYSSPGQSFSDYVKFLQTNSRYKEALKQTSASAQLKAIAAAGYAEDKNYFNKLETIYFNNIKPAAQFYVSQNKGISPVVKLTALALLTYAIIKN